jgi:Ca2+-transporting ATPase
MPLPLLPLQILYLNLVTDVFPAFALAMGEGEADILNQPPRDPKTPIIGRAQWLRIVLYSAALTAGVFAAIFAARRLGLDARQSVTVAFLTLAFAQLWHAFNMRDAHSRLLANDVVRNAWLWAALALCTALLAAPPYLPPAAHLLNLAPLDASMWTVVLVCSLAPALATQAVMVVAASRIGRRR